MFVVHDPCQPFSAVRASYFFSHYEHNFGSRRDSAVFVVPFITMKWFPSISTSMSSHSCTKIADEGTYTGKAGLQFLKWCILCTLISQSFGSAGNFLPVNSASSHAGDFGWAPLALNSKNLESRQCTYRPRPPESQSAFRIPGLDRFTSFSMHHTNLVLLQPRLQSEE
jgi:hypothetical protein